MEVGRHPAFDNLLQPPTRPRSPKMRSTLNQLNPELATILPQLCHPPLIRFRSGEFILIPVDNEDVGLRVVNKLVQAIRVSSPAKQGQE